MNKFLPLFLLSFLFFTLFTSCKPQQKTPFGQNPKLENKVWLLKELNGKAILIPTDGKELNIKFEVGDNTFGGNGGCNTINGMFTVQEDMIKIHSMASTKMACPQLETESEYFQMLDKVNRYELKKKKERGIEKEILLLYADKIQIATFEAQ